MRWLIRAALALALLYGAFVGVVYWKMTQPPLEFAKFWAGVPSFASRTVPFRPLWARARAGRLEVGDQAPDFELEFYDHSGKMKLSDLRGRPVVLAFGSYT
jgi:hypothetical protein